MTYWAILSGIEGNCTAYAAVLDDIKRQQVDVEALYILGDAIGPTSESVQLIDRFINPLPGELEPQVCQGWWEEQLLTLYGLGRTGEPTELIDRYGMSMVKTLWDAIPRSLVEWIRALDFGFFELDCLLVHGSSASASDELTPETSPIQILDRLMRMNANSLFCGRSGLTFQYEIQQGCVTSTVTTLEQSEEPVTTTVKPRKVIGVGNVGRIPGQADYTFYNPLTDRVTFNRVSYGKTSSPTEA